MLHKAARSGDSGILQYFIENGSDIFSKTKDGRNCLHIATQEGHLKICRSLLQTYNFGIHARDDYGYTVLLRTAWGGDSELFQYLIQNGGDVFSKTKKSGSCTHLAANGGHLKVCRTLFQNCNIDIHARDDDGWSVLHHAALSGNLELLQYFIQNGSDVFSETKDVRSCLHLSAKEGHLEICRVLFQNYNFDIDSKDDYGMSMLHQASFSGDSEVLQYLIEKGGNIFSKTKDSENCLHFAAQTGHLGICRTF